MSTVAALERRAAVARLLAERGDMLVVTGLGSASFDVHAAGDTEANFYLWGAMGGAIATALGLALAQPKRRVLAITGDGELLMGLGSLATVAVQAPNNLVVAVLDNGLYGETGGQQSHTGFGVDPVGVALACGFAWALEVADDASLEALCARLVEPRGPGLARVRIGTEAVPRSLPPRDGVYLKNRLRAHLGFEVS